MVIPLRVGEKCLETHHGREKTAGDVFLAKCHVIPINMGHMQFSHGHGFGALDPAFSLSKKQK